MTVAEEARGSADLKPDPRVRGVSALLLCLCFSETRYQANSGPYCEKPGPTRSIGGGIGSKPAATLDLRSRRGSGVPKPRCAALTKDPCGGVNTPFGQTSYRKGRRSRVRFAPRRHRGEGSGRGRTRYPHIDFPRTCRRHGAIDFASTGQVPGVAPYPAGCLVFSCQRSWSILGPCG